MFEEKGSGLEDKKKESEKDRPESGTARQKDGKYRIQRDTEGTGGRSNLVLIIIQEEMCTKTIYSGLAPSATK